MSYYAHHMFYYFKITLLMNIRLLADWCYVCLAYMLEATTKPYSGSPVFVYKFHHLLSSAGVRSFGIMVRGIHGNRIRVNSFWRMAGNFYFLLLKIELNYFVSIWDIWDEFEKFTHRFDSLLHRVIDDLMIQHAVCIS